MTCWEEDSTINYRINKLRALETILSPLNPFHIVMCRVVHATKMTGSSSNDRIY
jgi:hypothetical protein